MMEVFCGDSVPRSLWKSWAQGVFSSNFPKLLPQSSPFWQLLHIVLEEQHLTFSVEGAWAMKPFKKLQKPKKKNPKPWKSRFQGFWSQSRGILCCSLDSCLGQGYQQLPTPHPKIPNPVV